MLAILLGLALCNSVSLAAPLAQPCDPYNAHTPYVELNGCNVSNAQLPLPPSAAAAGLAIPAGQKPAFIALGHGVQVS